MRKDLIHLPFALWARLPIAMFVLDMECYEILYANQYMKKTFGAVEQKKCWQVLQKGQNRPCSFCPSDKLFDDDGMPGPVHKWRLRNTLIDRWLEMTESAMITDDGRKIKIQFLVEIEEEKALPYEKGADPRRLHGAIATTPPDDIITMCSNCYRIRDEWEKWQHPAFYIQQYLGPSVSHGICPECVKELYPDLFP